MARGINKVILVGNLGADPETRYTAAGAAITTIRVATSESWRDKQSGEMQERTEWHRVKFFGRLAEICGQYLHKGKFSRGLGLFHAVELKEADELKFSAEQIAGLVKMVDDGTISSKIAKQVFEEMAQSGANPAKIVEAKGLVQISDPALIGPIIDEIMVAVPVQNAPPRLSPRSSASTQRLSSAMRTKSAMSSEKVRTLSSTNCAASSKVFSFSVLPTTRLMQDVDTESHSGCR